MREGERFDGWKFYIIGECPQQVSRVCAMVALLPHSLSVRSVGCFPDIYRRFWGDLLFLWSKWRAQHGARIIPPIADRCACSDM